MEEKKYLKDQCQKIVQMKKRHQAIGSRGAMISKQNKYKENYIETYNNTAKYQRLRKKKC